MGSGSGAPPKGFSSSTCMRSEDRFSLGRAHAKFPSCDVAQSSAAQGSVRGCLDHLTDKHGGSTFFALNNVAKFFPPWTVTRDVWQTALRPDVSGIAVDACLFHEAGCRLVHRYHVYKDPFPHPALRGGGGVIPRLLSFVGRAMAIAQLTQLRISIPASGAPPDQVPADCYPGDVGGGGDLFL